MPRSQAIIKLVDVSRTTLVTKSPPEVAPGVLSEVRLTPDIDKYSFPNK